MSSSPRPAREARSPAARLALYLCCAAEVVFGFGDAVGLMPWTRLVESVICQRHAAAAAAAAGGGVRPPFEHGLLSLLLLGGQGGPTAETTCKGDLVQAEMAELMGGLASLGSIPGLFLIVPFSMLAKRMDRRLIIIVNAVSLICGNLFLITTVLIPNVNLKFLWLAGFFSLFGGGGPVFHILLRSIIAESVEPDRLSSVLYVLSGLGMLVRLGGVVLGSWLLQYGAVAANILSVALVSIALPILGLLPQSVARAPRSAGSDCSRQQKPPVQQGIALEHLIPKTGPDSTEEAKVDEDAPCEDRHGHNKHWSQNRSRSWRSLLAAFHELDYVGLVQKYTHLPIHNPLCFVFLAIMFVNSVAMGVRDQAKTWISTRYGWSLAEVGYILSAESVAGVAVLFALPWLDRVRSHSRRPPTSSHAAATVEEATVQRQSHAGGEPEGDEEEEDEVPTSDTVRKKRRGELRVARASLVFGAAGSLVVTLAADRVPFILGLVVMTGAVGFIDAVRAFCTSFFAVHEIQALYAAVTVVEMLGVILGSPVWGWIFAQAYHGGSLLIGMPFGVYAVLLLCVLSLLSFLKP